MTTVKKVTFLVLATLSLAFTACQEDVETLVIKDITSRPPQDIPDDFTSQPSDVPYPKIIKQYYPADLAYYQGCMGWRIEWPVFADDVDPDKISTFFATSTGELNSLDLLQSADPSKKNKATFSLYTDQKIEAATEVSDLWDWMGIGAEAVYFRKINKTVDQIEKWVTNRPSNFENYWDDAGDIETEMTYQANDFVIFQLPGQSPIRYGGIRVVSTSPRIMEVYLAIPQ